MRHAYPWVRNLCAQSFLPESVQEPFRESWSSRSKLVDCTGVNIEMNTNALEHSLSSLICNMLVQKCLTEVIGTILVLKWVLC